MAAVRVAPYPKRLERLRTCVPREGRNGAWQPVAVLALGVAWRRLQGQHRLATM